ncbi:hypothetical protein K9L97_06070 [Candidatus Woesearchaeota archaeon]|nr:hypothetical protein [Candidatus Woesearchaeota archaeon]
MDLIIDKNELSELIEKTAIGTCEKSFILVTEPKNDVLIFKDMPYVLEEQKYGANHSLNTAKNDPKIKKIIDSLDSKYKIFEGHSHARSLDETIQPMDCGWIIDRFEENRDYVHDQLCKTEEGFTVLKDWKKYISVLSQNYFPTES